MGNTPSIQHKLGLNDADNPHEPDNGEDHHSHMKNLLGMDKGRQSSITSQLFPSRKSRHTQSGLGNLKRKRHNIVSHPPSLFKKNYSLEVASAGAQGPTNNGNSKLTNDDPRGFSDRKSSTENVRENMAELSISKFSNDNTGPMLFRPSPATPTVQPTKEEVIPPMDENTIFPHRQSVVALRQNLEESQPPSIEVSSTSIDTKANPVDVKKTKPPKPLPEQATATTATATATATTTPVFTNGRPSVDTDPESFDTDNINDDGCLQSRDIVLNQSLLHNVIKRDMKRKRDKETNDNGSDRMAITNTAEQDSKNNNTASTDTFYDNTLGPRDKYGTTNGHNVAISLTTESPPKQDGTSDDSLESGQSLDAKKLKPTQHDTLLPHTNSIGKIRPDILQQHGMFQSLDSFEKGSVEHREVEDQNRTSSLSSLSSSSVSGSAQDIRVVIKWRDRLPGNGPNKMFMISEDIASTLNFEKRRHDIKDSFPMKYEERAREWIVPDLMLPIGVYRLQFLINNELRHSNYLPTATDSVGNFVNWLEVIPGYDEVVPYRDGMERESRRLAHAKDDENPTSASSLTHEGSQGTVLMESDLGKVSGRPPLIPLNHSLNKFLRSNTPSSDYTGGSRSSSALRKSPTSHSTSSLDLTTALQPKKYKYSNEIPELFKTTPTSQAANDDGQFTFGHMEPPKYDLACQNPFNEIGSDNQVVDCNQDKLFTELQQGGFLDAETAEQLFLEKYPVPDLPIYLNSYYLNQILSEFQKNSHSGIGLTGINHIIPHVNLNHLLTSSIRDEMISVGCTTRYEGKFITQVIYAPCYYENSRNAH